MGSTIKSQRLRIGGMTCESCRNKIEKKLNNTAGIASAKVNFASAVADVAYDPDIISAKAIAGVIERLGYEALPAAQWPGSPVGRVAASLGIILALYVILQSLGILNLLVPSQLAEGGMGYGMLFVVGLMTSVHCVAMCGGINLSQCLPRSALPEQPKGEKSAALAAFAPAALYNLGRVISYTVIGFLLGLAGMLLGGAAGSAGLPALIQGILKLVAGAFMVIMGINMLGLFPWLRKLQPRMPGFIAKRINAGKSRGKGPLVVGLLNGLMPCGPLQAMQILALASGDPIRGGLSMLVFSLGTVPLMLGLGSLVAALGRKFAGRVTRAGAILVVVLGLAMLAQGGSLSGLLEPTLLLILITGLSIAAIVASIPFRRSAPKALSLLAVSALTIAALLPLGASRALAGAQPAKDGPAATQELGEQVINSTLKGGRYPNITVQAGRPVKWIIEAPEGSINGCNYKLNIREYGIRDYALQPGENVIEFTPAEAGKFSYSCWMGMIRANITVVEGEVPAEATPAQAENPAAYPELDTDSAPSGGCCG